MEQDYEYASYNPIAYDLANHFCEMAADYHSDTPHVLDYSKYPGKVILHDISLSVLHTQYTIVTVLTDSDIIVFNDNFLPDVEERQRFVYVYLSSKG